MIRRCEPLLARQRLIWLKSRATEGTMRFLSLRAVFLLGFVVAMPVLALPPVARRIDELLYGPPPTDFGRPPVADAPLADFPAPQVASGQVAPVRYDEPSPAAGISSAPNDLAFSPPPLTPAPEFAIPSPPPQPATDGGASEPRIDERTIARLTEIRQKLEQLGAEYVIVETMDGGRFRFHCRMLVDDRSRFTRPFEASSFDCVAAGEQVLRDVEAWRLAAASPSGSVPR